jgi:predicted deacylase
LEKIVKHFDLLLDLHTASHGRVNSLYLRADLENEATRILAFLQNPQIIVQKDDGEGTLRGWANDHNIPAITVEIGNPNAFQPLLVDETLDGIINTLRHYEMLAGDVKDLVTNAIVCDHSYWIYSTKGGIVEVLPSLADTIKKGQLIAKVYDVFGQVREQIYSNRHGVVIGKNVLPNCDAGTRILHIGVDLVGADPELIPGHEEFTGD